MKTLKDIKEVIRQTGLTECEDHCNDCEFDKKLEDFKPSNLCLILNAIYRIDDGK